MINPERPEKEKLYRFSELLDRGITYNTRVEYFIFQRGNERFLMEKKMEGMYEMLETIIVDENDQQSIIL